MSARHHGSGRFAAIGPRQPRTEHPRKYVSVANPNRADDLWIVNGARTTCYARADLAAPEQVEAVQAMIARDVPLTADQARALAHADAMADFGAGA